MRVFFVKKKPFFKRESTLFVLMALGAVSGICFGGFAGKVFPIVENVGQLFLKALGYLVYPVIFFSLISALGQVQKLRELGQLGLRTLVYYLSTTALAVITGLIFVNVFHPGQASQNQVSFNAPEQQAPFLLYFILTSLFLGFLILLFDREKKLTKLVGWVNERLLHFVHLFLWLAPIGIFALLATHFGQKGGFGAIYLELAGLFWYAVTVVCALFFHAIIHLGFILSYWGKQKIPHFFNQVSPAIMTALATSSSSASLAVTLDCLENRAKVDKKISRFVAPLGATINMDGTALYEAVAALFIAQVYGISLGFGEQLIVFLMASLAAIGAAGVPQAGLITMVWVLQAAGLPIDGIALLMAVDWLLDRFRTATNVWGDAVGAKVVEQSFYKTARKA